MGARIKKSKLQIVMLLFAQLEYLFSGVETAPHEQRETLIYKIENQN